MYFGEFSCKIDNNNRIVVPAKFDCAKEKFIITFIDEDTLIVAKRDGWTPLVPIKGSVIPKEKYNLILNYIRYHSEEVSTDSQRRLVIPASFIDKLSFDRKCLVVGSGDTFQIVNEDKYYKDVLNNQCEYEEFMSSKEGKNFKMSLIHKF